MVQSGGALLVFLSATALLAHFFLQDLAPLVFLPWVAAIALAGWFRPVWGLALYIVSALVTVQVPILAGTPFFAGPEPGFLALAAVFALHRLRSPGPVGLPPRLGIALMVYMTATLLSAGAAAWALPDLPAPWPARMLTDAAEQIFFWRWMNPHHFLRMTLVLVEGLAAFWIALHIVRSQPSRAGRILAWAFAGCAFLLAGYSFMELVFRGKQISLFPGFGPVFNDRNAYAAFWVMATPVCLGLGFGLSGLLRVGMIGLGVAGIVFCVLSLSMTGLLGMLVALACWALIALTRGGRLGILQRIPARKAAAAAGLTGIAAVVLVGTVFIQREDLHLRERLGERTSFWLPAMEIITESPVFGIGPGQFFRQLPRWRDVTDVSEVSAFEHENVHNYYLQLAAENGLPAALAFVAIAGMIVVPAVRLALRQRDEETEAAEAAGLWVPGIAGILTVLVSQHPLLLFSFQSWYWIALGTVAAHNWPGSEPSPNRRIGPYVIALLACGILAMIHFSTFVPAVPDPFTYGVHAAGPGHPESARITAPVAVIRTPQDPPGDNLTFRSLHASQLQRIAGTLLGNDFKFELAPGESRQFPIPGGREGFELSVVVSPPADLVFADRLGAGVLVEGLPEGLEVEPGPRD